MLIRKEEFIVNGMEVIRESYGPDEETVTSTIEYAKPTEGGEDPAVPPESEATQLDRIEAQTAYIAMMMNGGEV